MGKNAGKKRKANPGVGVDFKRVKHKVGKKLPKAQNETTVDIKSRSIALPSQNLTAEKAGAAVSERNLTLQELLGQVGHYSEKTRRDALQQLQQLLGSHPGELRRHAATVMRTLAPRVSDASKPARAALRTLFSQALLPGLGASQMAPFMPLLMAHVGSALTHLEPSVRADALGLLDTLMDAVPELVVGTSAPAAAAAVGGAGSSGGGYLGQCLEHYRGQLSRGLRGRSISAQAVGPLADTLAQLRRFLERALPDAGGAAAGDASTPALPAADAAGPASKQQQAPKPPPQAPPGTAPPPAGALHAFRCAWAPPAAGFPSMQALLQLYAQPSPPAGAPTGGDAERQLSHESSGPSGRGGQAGGPTAADGGAGAAAQQLLNSLWECWAECAPGALSTSPEEAPARALAAILRCSNLLTSGLGLAPPAPPGDQSEWQHGGGGGDAAAPAAPPPPPPHQQRQAALEVAALVLPKLAPHFPLTAPAVAPPAPVLELLCQYNLQAAQLLASFVAAGVTWPPQTRAGARASHAEAAWASTLVAYVCRLVLDGRVLPPNRELAGSTDEPFPGGGPAGKGGASAGRRGPAGGAAAAAGQLQALLLAARLMPWLPPPERSRLLAAVGQAAGRAPLRSPQRTSCLRLQRGVLLPHLRGGGWDPALDEAAAAWLSEAPKLLWDLGDKSPETSEVLLQTLHDCARFAPSGSPLHEALVQAAPQLAPLLATALPPRDRTVPVAAGPLTKLPAGVQAGGLDLLAALPCLPPPLLRSALLVARTAALPLPAALRLLDGLLHRAPRALPPDQYLSFVGSLLAPPRGVVYVAAGAAPGAAAAAPPCMGGSLSRHLAVVRCVCCWLPSYGAPRQLLALLEGALLREWRQAASAASAPSGSAEAPAPVDARTLAASLVCVAAAAVGSATNGEGEDAEGGASAAASSLPAGLEAELPGVVAALCCAWPCAEGGDAPVGGGGDGACGAHGVEWAVDLSVPLLTGQPGLAMPTLEALAALACGELEHQPQAGQQQQQQQRRLLACIQAVQRVLAQRPLRRVWLVHGQRLRELHAALAAAAGGEGARADLEAALRQLKAALDNCL